MKRTKKLAGLLALTACACSALALGFAETQDVSAETSYTKVAFTSVEGNCWEPSFPLTNAIDGDAGNIVAFGEWGLTGFFQSEEAMLLTFAEESVIDRLVINYFGGITYTAAWRVEVSNDNQNWARITPKAAEGATIYNNEIIQTSSRTDTELVIDFDAVSCTYVRLTMVIKQAWGSNCCGGLSEVTAYVSEGAVANAATCGKAVAYTAEATSVTAGEATSLNDGKNKMFINDGSGSLVIWEYGTVTFTLAQATKTSAIRIYPNGWEVGTTDGITDNGDNTYTINESAFTNNQVASGLKFEGSVDGTEWTTLGEYSDIGSHIFAHTFAIPSATEIGYVRMTITGLSLQPHISAYGEIEIYDAKAMQSAATETATLELADGDYKTTYLQGETLDVTGLNVLYTAVGEDTVTVPVTADMVSGYSAKKVGEQTLTITYQDLTVEYKVNVQYPAATGTKLAFSAADFVGNQFMSSAGGLFDGNLVSPSILGYWGMTDFYNFYEPLTFTIADSSLTDGKAAVDNVRVYLDSGRLATDVFMVEVSLDKTNWARVNYKASDDVVIMNNGVGFADKTTKSYIDIGFETVYAKYIRVTALSKALENGICLGYATEVEAYCNDATNVKTLTGGALQNYTYTATSVDASSKDGALNDNANLYFGQNNAITSDCLNLFGGANDQGTLTGDATVTLTLENYIKASRIMLFPNGYNVLNTKPGTDSPIPNASVNKSLPKAFKVDGSADGENWIELGSFADIGSYNFAQDFALKDDYTVKYLRLTVLNVNENSMGMTELAELQVYGDTVADFEYKKVGSLELLSAKQVYMPDDELDITGMQIKATSNDGGITVQTIDVTADMVTGFDTSTYGAKTATITYEGVTCNYEYVVATIDRIEVLTNPTKTVYNVGETPDYTGMSVKVYYTANGTEGSFDVTNVAPYATLDTSVANNAAVITVEYYGKTATANVVVKTVASISINSTTHKTSYYIGGKLDVTGLTIEVTYTDDSKETVAVTADMVSGFSSAAIVAQQTVTVTYANVTTTYTVEIKEIPGVEKPDEDKGCGSSVALGATTALIGLGAALIIKKRKEN